MKIPEKMYQSNILRGRDLEDSTEAVIQGVETVMFGEGTDREREAVSLTVSREGVDTNQSFSPGMRQIRVLVEAFGDNTDNWVGKKIRLTPVPSQTPDGKPTTSLAITIAKKK